MAHQTHFVRIGAFIVLGVILLLTAIVILGAGAVFTRYVPAETYFNESVQGLDLGAPVKFRGVQIGTVKSIGFAGQVYDEALQSDRRYVMVQMQLYENVVDAAKGTEQNSLSAEFDKGLRVRLSQQGLTGVAFLEINYVNPEHNPPLPINWTPETIYIPSAPSTMTRIDEAVTDISRALNNISTIDFKGMADSLNNLFANLDKSLSEANVQSLGELVAQDLTELRDLLKRGNALMNDPALAKIGPGAAHVLTSADTILTEVKNDLRATLQESGRAAANLADTAKSLQDLLSHENLKRGLDELPQTMNNLQAASESIHQGSVRFDKLMRNMQSLIERRRGELDSILTTTDSVLKNVEDLTGSAKDNPSSFLFSTPPAPVNQEVYK
jgi:paraquat-inducible protein B